MSDLIEKFALPILLVLLGGGGLASLLVSRLVPQRKSAEDKMTEVEKRLNESSDDMEKIKLVVNAQADYIFELRQHIAEGRGPTPPPYPEGLKVR